MDPLHRSLSSKPAPVKPGLAVFVSRDSVSAIQDKALTGAGKNWHHGRVWSAVLNRFPRGTFLPGPLEAFQQDIFKHFHHLPTGSPIASIERPVRLGLEFLKAGIEPSMDLLEKITDHHGAWTEEAASAFALYNQAPGDWNISYLRQGETGQALMFKSRKGPSRECVLDIPVDQGWWSFFWAEPARGLMGLVSPLPWDDMAEARLRELMIPLGFSGAFSIGISALSDGFSQTLDESILLSVDITV